MTLDGGKYKGISSKFVYESIIVNCVLDSLLSCRCGSTKIHASHPAPLLRPDTSKTGGLGVGTSLSQASNIELKSRGVARGVPGDGLSPKTRVGLESIPPCSGTTSGVSLAVSTFNFLASGLLIGVCPGEITAVGAFTDCCEATGNRSPGLWKGWMRKIHFTR